MPLHIKTAPEYFHHCEGELDTAYGDAPENRPTWDADQGWIIRNLPAWMVIERNLPIHFCPVCGEPLISPHHNPGSQPVSQPTT